MLNGGSSYHRNPEKYVWLADWKKHRLPYCSVYIVSPDGQWPCKVGISTHAYKRLAGLQTSVWKPLKVMGCYWAKTVHEARALEKAVHKRLSEDSVWLHGEWFDMRPKQAKEMIEFVAMVEGIEIYDEIDNPDVMSDIKALVAKFQTSRDIRAIIDHGNHYTFGDDHLAELANQYKEDGIVLPKLLAEMVMEMKEHEEERQLPTLRQNR